MVDVPANSSCFLHAHARHHRAVFIESPTVVCCCGDASRTHAISSGSGGNGDVTPHQLLLAPAATAVVVRTGIVS